MDVGRYRTRAALMSPTRRCAGMLALALLLASFHATPASAETSLTVRPGKIETTVRPGGDERHIFEVVNEGASTVTVEPAVMDCRVSGEGVVLSTPGGSTGSSAEWMVLADETLVIPPLDRRSVDLTLRMPASAEEGVYRSAVLFSPRRSPSKSPGFTINGRIAVQVIANVKPEQPFYLRFMLDRRVLAGLSVACLSIGVGLLLLDARRRRAGDPIEGA